MAYYEPQGWQAPATRQVSWEQPVPPSRSGTFMSRLRCRGTEKKETNTHSLCLLQAPARSLSARKCQPSPLSLTVWTRFPFYIQSVVFRGQPAVDEFRRTGMCKAAGSTALAWTYSNIVLTWSPNTEVDRAIDNLVKSGKLWAAPRRDSMPLMMGRPYPDYGMILFPRSVVAWPS